MARRRGGYRQPSSPAAVSGPGSLSQRTDGGPSAGSYRQSGLPYGDNQAVNQQIQSAPMEPQGGGGRPAAAGGARGPRGIFGATDRPQEPITAGIDFGPGTGMESQLEPAEDPDYLIRAAISRYPHLADHLIGLLSAG